MDRQADALRLDLSGEMDTQPASLTVRLPYISPGTVGWSAPPWYASFRQRDSPIFWCGHAAN